MLYRVLNQRNPAYCGELWCELEDLYAGGYAMAANAKKYMPRLTGESPTRYQDRCQAAGYISYLGQIVDYFASALFAQNLSVSEASDADDPTTPGGKSDTDFYTAFAADADLRGHAFAQIAKCVFRTALLKRRALMMVDFPTAPQAALAASRADEAKIGTSRAYVQELPLEQLIDWEYDDVGGFAFAVLYRQVARRADPTMVRNDAIRHEFKVWSRDEKGAVRWDTFAKVKKKDEAFGDDEDVPPVDGGATTFQAIPIVEFELPDGLWVGNKIGTLAKEHYQRRAALVSAEYKSLVVLPVAKLGPEIGAIAGAMPSDAQQNPNRGVDPVGQFQLKGYTVIGADDDICFAEPSGTCYELVGKELNQLKDEMFRVVHQMAASVTNVASQKGQSGDSKREDRAAEAIVLAAFGQAVRDFAKRVYTCISRARSEDVVWTPRGLDRFENVDRDQLLAESVQVDLIGIPSPTFKKTYKTELALKLVETAPPATQDLIRQEIQDGVDAEQEIRDLMDDAKKDAIQNPPPPAPPQQQQGRPPMQNGAQQQQAAR